MNLLQSPLGRLRAAALAEGVSYLLLLFAAMPLKYFFGIPMAVRIVGLAHGVLFIVFGVTLLAAWTDRRWPLTRPILVFIASLVPLGAFVMDRDLKREHLSLPTP